MALPHARGKLGLEEDYVHASGLGTRFVGRLLAETSVGGSIWTSLTQRRWKKACIA